MTLPLSLILIHWVADFVLQSNWMALNKSKSTKEGYEALYLHALVYSVCFLPLGVTFALITFLFHFWTDFVTSRITSELWFFRMHEGAWQHIDVPSVRGTDLEKERLFNPFVYEGGNRHYFFLMIGLDQVLHYVQLAVTYYILFNINSVVHV